MDVSVYFPRNFEVGREEIEDEFEAVLGTLGGVAGWGSGDYGSNIDLDVDDGISAEEVLELVRSVLGRTGVKRAKIVIDGTEHHFPSDR